METRNQLHGSFATRTALLSFSLVVYATSVWAATDVRVNFTLNTVDRNGVAVTQSRYYYVYRPDGLSKATPVPMILRMECVPNEGAATFLHRKADQAGFVVVSCSFSGNSSGTPGSGWSNHSPYVDGFEDMDYTTEVINQVRQSQNCNDAFICGLSKGGHMAYAYACTRPDMLRAACSIDEFMELTVNLPTAPLPILAFQGTLDNNVPYTMQRDAVDIWRTLDGLMGATPVTTYESSPTRPGQVTQAAWRGGINGTQVAFVTIIGGTHRYAVPGAETGYNCTDGMWAFFSQFLTSTQAAPKIVSQPVNNIQLSGQPASFWVVATGNPPLAYQWQRNGVDIPDATANWYTTPTITMADNGATFRAIVSNGAGSAASTGATLTVRPAPADPQITTQPADQTVTAGQPVTFTVAATSSNAQSRTGSTDQSSLSYQWTKNGMDVVGATAATLTLPAALTADSGALFRTVVSSSSGSVTSIPATLTVKPAPGAPIIITDPARVRVLTGQTGTFSVSAWSFTPMSYQWQKGQFLMNMADIPGATGATYTTPPTVPADQHALFRCVVSNTAGATTSATEMLFATTAPTAPTQIAYPITAFGQVGVPFRYTIISTGGTTPLTYSASRLPTGLSLDSAAGVISGTPAAAGTYDIPITAGNRAGSVSATLTLTVTFTPPAIPIDAWRAVHFGASQINPEIAGDSADPDGDGANNLLEYTNGTDPLAAEVVP
jgi:poly(3-hydroxybutyrate) depolymerase